MVNPYAPPKGALNRVRPLVDRTSPGWFWLGCVLSVLASMYSFTAAAYNAWRTALPGSDVPRHQVLAYAFFGGAVLGAGTALACAVLAVKAARRKRGPTSE